MALLLLAACLTRAEAADDAGWQIVSVTGTVSVQRAGAMPVSLGSKDGVAPGDVLQTGPDARLVLRRGGDTIFIAPNSNLAIPPDQPGGITNLLQGAGTLLFKVEPRATPNFQVRTPYLTAVVKGTSFSVTVDGNGAGVHVLTGQVQVNDATSAQSALLTPGSSARIGATPGRALQLDGPAKRLNGAATSATTTSSPFDAGRTGPRIVQPIALAAIDVERSSRGLVRNDRSGGSQGRGGHNDSESGKGDGESAKAEKSSAGGRSAFATGSGIGGGFGNSGNGNGNGNGGGNGSSASGGSNGNSGSGGGGGNGNGGGNSNSGGESSGNSGKGGKKKK